MVTGASPKVPILIDRPVLTLSFVEGPELGRSVRLDQALIRLGRSENNDLVIADSGVVSCQGVFHRVDEGFTYHDEEGSPPTSASGDANMAEKTLKGPILFQRQGYLRMGSSLLHLHIDRVYHSECEAGASHLRISRRKGGRLVAMRKSLTDDRLKFRDPRLDTLFKLVGRLNALRHLDETLMVIEEVVFQIFPAADLFSVCLLEGKKVRPKLVRTRSSEQGKGEALIDLNVLDLILNKGEAILTARTLGTSQATCMCAPLAGQHGVFGLIQIESTGGGRFNGHDLDLLFLLTSHLAFALERARLTDNIFCMFDGFVEASMAAIEARDPATAGHSERVATYSVALAEAVCLVDSGPLAQVGFTPIELTELRYAALLHDFGKVGVREAVLSKGDRLSSAQMNHISQRYSLLLMIKETGLQQELFNQTLQENRPATEQELAQLREQVDQFGRELQEWRETINQARTQWRLSSEQMVRIKAWGERRMMAPDGREIPFLSTDELQNLTISTGTLTEKEWADMRTHVSQSESYLKRIPWSDDLKNVPCIAGAHHEKLDGSGYPLGLMAQDLSYRVRILTVADIFDAATAWDRPYCLPLTVDRAARLLERMVERGKLDGDLVELFNRQVLPGLSDLIPVRNDATGTEADVTLDL